MSLRESRILERTFTNCCLSRCVAHLLDFVQMKVCIFFQSVVGVSYVAPVGIFVIKNGASFYLKWRRFCANVFWSCAKWIVLIYRASRATRVLKQGLLVTIWPMGRSFVSQLHVWVQAPLLRPQPALSPLCSTICPSNAGNYHYFYIHTHTHHTHSVSRLS